MVLHSSYHADIMLNAFIDPLCSKLCWHRRWVPNKEYSQIWPEALSYRPFEFIDYSISDINCTRPLKLL